MGLALTNGMLAEVKGCQFPAEILSIDGGPPGSSVPGILQARTLEWVSIPSPMHESEK